MKRHHNQLGYATRLGEYPLPRRYPSGLGILMAFNGIAGIGLLALDLVFFDVPYCSVCLLGAGVAMLVAVFGALARQKPRRFLAVLLLLMATLLEAAAMWMAHLYVIQLEARLPAGMMLSGSVLSMSDDGRMAVACEMLSKILVAFILLTGTLCLCLAIHCLIAKPPEPATLLPQR